MEKLFIPTRSTHFQTLVPGWVFFVASVVSIATILLPLSVNLQRDHAAIVLNNAYAADCTETAKSKVDNTVITLQKVTLPGNVAGCQGTNNRIYVYNSEGVLVGYDGVQKGFPFAEYPDEAGLGKLPGPIKCTSLNDFWGQPVTCLGRTLSAVIGSALITASAWLLQMAALLFNWLIYYTIIAFGDVNNGFLTAEVLDGIHRVWTVFRDISNILIIGIFVFISISIILGLEEFGQKKMIARALIIAILINFSLLFTKIVVDGSNFIAYQFYTAAITQSAPNSQSASTESAITSFSKDGLAGSFIKIMGITSIGDTYTKLKEGADSTNNGWVALLHGLFSAAVLLAAALVFLYGSFIVITRAILVVFLLITSSLAFASYLLPVSVLDGYGWSIWWKTLFKNAILAPLLLMLLWAALILGTALRPEGGTLGALLDKPDQAGNLAALFSYLIILGFLFAAIKISSKFSTSISGFNYAAMIPGIGLAASARIAGFAGRNFVGRPALRASEALQARAKGREGTMMGNLYKFGSQGLKGVGKSDFNAMRTPLGAGVAGLSGMKVDALAGKKIGGAEGARKIAAKRAAENAEFFNVGKDEKREREEKGINAELRSNPELAQRHAEASHAADSHEAEHKDAAAKHKEAQEELLKAVAALERARGGDADAAAAAETAVSKSQANLETQANRIKKATQHLGLAKQVVKNIEDEAKSRAVASGNLKDFKNEGEIAATLAKSRFTSAFFTEAENKKIAEMARKEVGEHHEKKEAKKVLEYLKEKGGDDHEHGHDTPKPGSSPKPAAAAAHDEHKAAGGGHDDHKPH